MYLDNNASTPVDPEIAIIFQDIMLNKNIGNPHSAEHRYGWRGADIINDSKNIIAKFINALPDEIYFTSGATESNNWALVGSGLAAQKSRCGKNEIIISSVEHKCILNSADFLREFHGFAIKEIPIGTDGRVNIRKLEELITDRTLLVSVMAVNNEIGAIQPIKEIGRLCRQHQIIFHVDGAQGAYTNLDVIENNIDMLSLSAHKIYAPIGIGTLFINEDMALKPISLMNGGGQQNGLRAGTLSPALCYSMAKAIEILQKRKRTEIQYLEHLRSQFLSVLESEHIDYAINGSMKYRHPGNLNIRIRGIDAGSLISQLQPDIAISTGSACNAGIIKYSYVLQALGLNASEIESSVRIGFGRFNTLEEIMEAGAQFAAAIHKQLALINAGIR